MEVCTLSLNSSCTLWLQFISDGVSACYQVVYERMRITRQEETGISAFRRSLRRFDGLQMSSGMLLLKKTQTFSGDLRTKDQAEPSISAILAMVWQPIIA